MAKHIGGIQIFLQWTCNHRTLESDKHKKVTESTGRRTMKKDSFFLYWVNELRTPLSHKQKDYLFLYLYSPLKLHVLDPKTSLNEESKTHFYSPLRL